jgi:hypothetical protein
MSLVFIIGSLLLISLADRLDGDPQSNALVSAIGEILPNPTAMLGESREPGERIGHHLSHAFLGAPYRLLREQPWVALLALPLLFAWTALAGGAICRSAAGDFAQSVSIPWPQAVGFSLLRWRALLLSVLLPPLIVWTIALGLAVAGWALFSAPALNLIGAAVWPAFLFGGMVAAVVIVAFTIGWPMLLPSVACEGTDAIDAVQHAYSFVFARPLRLIAYLLLLGVQALVLTGLLFVLCWLGVYIAQQCALQWSGNRGLEVLGRLPWHVIPAAPEHAAGASVPARWMVGLWTLLPAVLPLAFVVSYFWSGSTVLYLAMRCVVDGQDTGEIWMPGIVEGTQARAPDPGAGPTSTPTAEAITDDGPADET